MFSAAYCATLQQIGEACAAICSEPGVRLQQALAQTIEKLAAGLDIEKITEAESTVRSALASWSGDTSAHFQGKAQEVKDILLVLTQTAQSVGERDDVCARQMSEVTAHLRSIGTLEDMTEIRASIEQSATDLKASIDRMTAVGKAAMDELRDQVSTYRARLEEAKHVASIDLLTGIGNRTWVEEQTRMRIEAGTIFSAVLMDIDGFKQVNDRFGHMAGDELLQQFAMELRSACKSTDALGRWGGDEFVIVMDCGQVEALVRTARLQQWVCGNYTLQTRSSPVLLRIKASIGLAEWRAGETMKDLLDHADAAMYRDKEAGRRV